MAMGERSPIALLNAPASGRMAIAEALTKDAGWTDGIAKLYYALQGDWMYEDAMRNVVDSIGEVTTFMQEISTATLEQSQGIAQVNRAIISMDDVTQQNAALVEQAAAAAQAMREQAQQLSAMVGLFKLDAHQAGAN